MTEPPEVQLSFWNFLFIGLSFIGLFFAIRLFSSSSKDKALNSLGVYLLLQSLVLLEYCFFWTNYIYQVPELYASTYLFALLYGPLLFIYFNSVFENPKPLISYAPHFIPFILFLLIKIPFYVSSPEVKFRHPELLPLSYFLNDRIDYTEIIKIIHLLAYGFILIRLIRANTLVGFMRQWSNWILGFFFLYIALTVIYWSIILFGEYTLLGDYFISLALCSSIALLAWFGDRYKKLKEGDSIPASLGFFSAGHRERSQDVSPERSIGKTTKITKEGEVKYKNSGLPNSLAHILAEELELLMSHEQLYKENDLKLETLAKKLNSNRHFVSQVINQFYGTNFFHFVNLKRIAAAKRLLEESGDPKLSIIEIAYEVGYNNKGTFNAVFKKITGVTPTEYRNSIH
jgi:AraC-like DNA-binding protein